MKASRFLLGSAAVLAVALAFHVLSALFPALERLPLSVVAGGSFLCVVLCLTVRSAPSVLALCLFAAAGLSLPAHAATITVPYGDQIAEGAHIASAVITPLLLLLLSKLTGPVGLFLRTFLGERLIRNAVDYAVNAVQGAAKGKTLSVTVGSEVLAQAVQYALDQGAPWLVAKLGGPDGIRLKIFRALDLEESASAALLRSKAPATGSTVRKAA